MFPGEIGEYEKIKDIEQLPVCFEEFKTSYNKDKNVLFDEEHT